jgi:nucleotide-binding universal stress UspA family protein
MKNVLLYANDDSGMESRLQAALDVARAFEGHISCVQVTPFDSFIMSDPFGGAYALPGIVEAVDKTDAAHRARIEDRLRVEGVSWDWQRFDGAPAQIVTARSGLSDLIVLSLPGGGSNYDGPLSIAGDVVVHARAPVLAIPQASRSVDCLGPVMIAWNGAIEAAHALRLTLSMLARASSVHIVTVSDDKDGFPAIDASQYLSRHGIGSELHEWPRDGRNTADALLDAARALGAAYVVMGAYGHSRMSETVLGGATRDMLLQDAVPLLLAH